MPNLGVKFGIRSLAVTTVSEACYLFMLGFLLSALCVIGEQFAINISNCYWSFVCVELFPVFWGMFVN